jgi:peptide/nickel transport system ATP-binding protein
MSRSSIRASAPVEGEAGGMLISIDNLHAVFATKRGREAVLNGVSLQMAAGDTFGLVGESGCGKSTLLKAILGVLAPNLVELSGTIRYKGQEIVAAKPGVIRALRWREISMIPQSALTSLDPEHTIGSQIVDAIQAHVPMSKTNAHRLASEMMAKVGVDPQRIDDFPHQFSGGMRQRAIIAMALVLHPDLVLADEPTTSLDVIVQDQIFSEIRKLQASFGFAMLLVSHDLGLVTENCNRVAVMYSGLVVEQGPTRLVIEEPLHPYTLGLQNSMASIGSDREPISIPGSPPDPTLVHAGCRFVARCPFAQSTCHLVPPETVVLGERQVACHRYREMPELRAEGSKIETWMRTASA